MEGRSGGHRGHHAGHVTLAWMIPPHKINRTPCLVLFPGRWRFWSSLCCLLAVDFEPVVGACFPIHAAESAAVLNTRRKDLPPVAKVPEWEAAGA